MSDDQDRISDALAERMALRKQQLGLDRPAAEPVGDGLKVEGTEAVTCRCGEVYRASVLHNGRQLIPWPSSCAKCRARKEQAEAEAADAAVIRLEERAAGGLKRRLAALEVPPKYADVSLDTFEHHGSPQDVYVQGRALNWARRYLGLWPDVDAFAVFQGGYGTGKGHVAWSIAKAVVTDIGGTAKVVKLPAMVRELRDTWRKDSATTYDAVLRTFLEPDLLVIDEASRHAFYGQQIHQHLYDVVDTRIELGKPTLMTTNEDDEGLQDVLKGALWNRLEGEGGVVPFGDASWRSRTRPDEPTPPAAA